MKDLKRQDRNGTRTSEELRRRYRLNDIELTADEVEYLKQFIEVDSFLSTSSIHPVQNKVITEALNSKVNKETGKGLSSNDFTDTLKEKLNSMTVITVLDTLDSISEIDALSANQGKILNDSKLDTSSNLTNTEIETLINNIVL